LYISRGLIDDDLLTELQSALEEVPTPYLGSRRRDRLLAGRQAYGDGERRSA
jgi:hypothetical protein